MSAAAARPVWAGGWWRNARAVPSPNFGARSDGVAVSLVVVHSISLPPGRYGGPDIERLFTNTLDCDSDPYYDGLRGLRVSAHFLIRRDGRIVQFVSCDDRAWHAGVSSWRGRESCNDFSIGIELEGLEGLAFDDPQYRALASTLRALRLSYPVVEVVGHEHVAPLRKHDPGSEFDWARLRDQLRRKLPRLWPALG